MRVTGGDQFVRLEGVSRRYGTIVALRDCTLTLSRGEVLGLAGPNGAGKSTIAKLITGFLRPSAGTIRIGGRSPADHRMMFGVGYLPEDLSSFWNRTPLDLLRVRETNRDAVLGIDQLSEALGLSPYLRRPLHTLSKGQKRLAFVAYAAMGPAALIVLDEPDSGLDPSAIDRLHALISTCARNGSTVVVLSHQLHETAEVSDWFAIVNNGRIAGWYDRDTVAKAGARNIYREHVNP